MKSVSAVCLFALVDTTFQAEVTPISGTRQTQQTTGQHHLNLNVVLPQGARTERGDPDARSAASVSTTPRAT